MRRTVLHADGGQISSRSETNVDELNTNKNEEERQSSSDLVKELKTICPSGEISKAIIHELEEKGITPARVALYREDELGLARFKQSHSTGNHPWLWPKQVFDELVSFESWKERSERQSEEFMAQFPPMG